MSIFMKFFEISLKWDVVYFHQHLGAAYSHFQHFICKKAEKSNKFAAKFSKKSLFLSLHQNAGQVCRVTIINVSVYLMQIFL